MSFLDCERLSLMQTGTREFYKLLRSQNEELYRQFRASRPPHVSNLGMSLILISLRKEFDSFMQNYNMHIMKKMVNELHAMLKLHEQTLTKKDPALHVIQAGKVQKKNNKQKKLQLATRGQNQGKGKTKLAYAPKPKTSPPPKRENPTKDSICHQCGDTCH
nr:zinc finger, CCHC-type [Tanacetum cinerariifolium]